jgi:L-lactate dehydrogenase
MTRRVGIIGTGWVGTSVAISVLHAGIAEEVLLDDVRREVAEGEAMDLVHGSAFYPSTRVRAAGLDEMAEVDAVVVAAGRGGTADQSRLDLLRENAAIVREIGGRLRAGGFDGLVVMVTNPVDVLTHVMLDASGLPPSRVLGTGTMLETARLRQMVGSRLGLDPRSVHALVVGEHGDSSVVLWSGALSGGRPLRAWGGWNEAVEAELAVSVRRAAYEIIRRKGATNHAIGLVTAHLLGCVLRDARSVLTVSRVQEGALGLEDVALSLPAVVGRAGAVAVVEPELTESERQALGRSAEILRDAHASVR